MFRQFLKVLEPVKNSLTRAVGGSTTGSHGEVSNYQRNTVTKEQQLTDTLKRSLPGITYVSVQDISGGCGAMYEINIEAKEFTGISRVMQHRLVTDTLKNEIAEMHGIRIHTTPPPASN